MTKVRSNQSERKKRQVHEILFKLDELPTIPTVVIELNKLINSPMTSIADVEELMHADIGLTTKILKLANSGYYAIPGGATSLSRAITYLGYDTVSQLALTASALQSLKAKNHQYFNVGQFWRHSAAVAIGCEVIGKELKYITPSDLFTCGLLHDMGKLALLIVDEENFIETVRFAQISNLSSYEAEIEMDSPRHTVIGRELAAKWQMPQLLQIATAHHHQKSLELRGGLSDEYQQVCDIVFLSNLLIHALQIGHSGHSKVIGLSKEVIDRLEISTQGLKGIIEKIKAGVTQLDSFLKAIDDG